MACDDRKDFTGETRDVIAGRAGYRCSFPLCCRVTIGPGANPCQTASIGVACHIYSASPNGPRGRGCLTPDQLKSPENGIWACEDHAKLVDTNEGKRYPAGTLLGWKALHEARIHHEMGGINLPLNWIEWVEVRRSPVIERDGRSAAPLFQPGQRLDLSKVTLLIGPNGSGKTALCDWIGASAQEGSLWRWVGSDLAFTLRIHDPTEHFFEIESVDRAFSYRLDGAPVPFSPLPVVVQVVRSPPPLPPRRNKPTDLEWMAGWLGMTPQLICKLAGTVARDSNPFAESIAVSDNGEIEAKLTVENEPFSLRALGGSSRVFTALALAVACANVAGLHAPTLLVLDCLWAFDTPNKELVLHELLRQERFQSMATLPQVDRDLSWGGWSVAFIREGRDGAAIEAA